MTKPFTAFASAAIFFGVITDSMCKNDHKPMKLGADDQCARACVKSGSKYVLFDGKKAYALSDQKTPEKFAAKQVKVTGTLYEKTGVIKVDRIENK
jgi:hypothetical protein